LDRPMHHRTIKAKMRGDLVLIEGSALPQTRKNEAASRGAARLSFQAFANCEVGSGQMCENRVFEDVLGNLRLRDRVRRRTHRTVTVVSRGRRHWGCAMYSRDFFPMAMTITIS